MTAPVDVATPIAVRPRASRTARWRLKRRHVLMLALAAEVLIFGARSAERYRPAGTSVNLPSAHGHIIT